MNTAFVAGSVCTHTRSAPESVVRLAQSMAAAQTEVVIFGAGGDSPPAGQNGLARVPTKTFPIRGPRQFGYTPGLAAAMRRSPADLVMSHGLWRYPSLATVQWHHRTRKPYIVHPHGMLNRHHLANVSWAMRLAEMVYEHQHLESAACIRARSRSELRAIRGYALSNPVCVIPNGVDLPTKTGSQDAMGGPLASLRAGGRKMLLYAGRISPDKGLPDLLRAWGQAQSLGTPEVRNWTLVIAGWEQRPLRAELQRLATRLELDWREDPAAIGIGLVFLALKSREAQAACYADCDAFILPACGDTTTSGVLEAWAHAKPVLMTRECSLPEGLKAGAAIPIGSSVEGIRAGLQVLFQASAASLADMGEAGRKLVTSRFTWDRVGREMAAVCQWVLGRGEKPGCVQG